MNKLIEIRKQKKARKPEFVSQDSWKQKRLRNDSWRRPKGMHSKMRLKHKGNPKMPSQGYRAPVEVRGMHPSGRTSAIINTPSQLENLSVEAIVIASTVGARKKLEIIKIAAEKKLEILNLNAEEFIKKTEKMLASRKEKAKKKQEKPEEKEKKSEKKEPLKKKEAESTSTEEEKRKAERKEMEKVITKRG